MENSKEKGLHKIQKILDALVENDRYSLIICINENREITHKESDLINLSMQPKKYLRETIKEIARKILEKEVVYNNI